MEVLIPYVKRLVRFTGCKKKYSPFRYRQSSEDLVRFKVAHTCPVHWPPTLGEPGNEYASSRHIGNERGTFAS